ncbi:MAG: PAS domain-containing sensor histidine kinase, partial [Oscillochloris sp.]|nr:PAS domain-containing sensor histidine kinase [Oscillochloris sp.]
MQWALRELRSQLRYQIIGPFLLLTIIVAVAGSLAVFSQVTGSLQDRFDNQLASVTRTANDELVNQEQTNLQFLREVAFAQRNDSTGAPGVADALASHNIEGLKQALDPFFRVAANRNNIGLDRLIAFDTSGKTVSDFEVIGSDASADYTVHASFDISETWFTKRVLSGIADTRGDKYAEIIQFGDTLYFATIAPVRNEKKQVVGGLIAATRISDLLVLLRDRAQAAGMTLYSGSGELISSTFGNSEGIVEAMDQALLDAFQSNSDPSTRSIFSTETISSRSYQFAYTPLIIRGGSLGILAPALSRDYVMATGNNTLLPLIFLVAILTLIIFIAGVFIANRITAPLGELAL